MPILFQTNFCQLAMTNFVLYVFCTRKTISFQKNNWILKNLKVLKTEIRGDFSQVLTTDSLSITPSITSISN